MMKQILQNIRSILILYLHLLAINIMSSYLSLFQMSLNQTNFVSFAQTASFLKQGEEEEYEMAGHRHHKQFSNRLRKMYTDVMQILCKIQQIADDLGQPLTCYVGRELLSPPSDTQSRRVRDYLVLRYLKNIVAKIH